MLINAHDHVPYAKKEELEEVIVTVMKWRNESLTNTKQKYANLSF